MGRSVSDPRSLPPGSPDPGHLLPAKHWQEVTREADRQAVRIAAGSPPPGALLPQRRTTGLLAVDGSVLAPRNGGRRSGGAPTFGVLHSAETPLRAGYAASMAQFFRDKAATSCHYMTDPAETWGILPDELVAWHCGNGNTNSLGVEQSGYARYSRAEWLTADGYAQMRRTAAIMRAAKARHGIGTFWMTDQQLRDAHARRAVGGWATHDQCRRVLGGTTHTDPGGGFPLDVQMQLADATTEDETMNAQQEQLLREVHGVLFSGTGATPVALTVYRRLVDVQASLNATLPQLLKGADVDETALATALAPLLTGPLVASIVKELDAVDGLTTAEAEAAAERAVRRVLGSVDA